MSIDVVLLHGDCLYAQTLPDGEEITFGGHKKDDVTVAGFARGQVAVRCRRGQVDVLARKAYGEDHRNVPPETVAVLDRPSKTAVFYNLSDPATETLTLPYQCTLRVGRSPDNEIVIRRPFVSSTHFVLTKEGEHIRVEDAGSTNGVYVNGRRVKVASLRAGDEVRILSVCIRLQNGALTFAGAGDGLQIRRLADVPAPRAARRAPEEAMSYRRSPRMRQKLPTEEIVLAAPPRKVTGGRRSGAGLFGRLAGTGAYTAATLAAGAASPALLAARAAYLVAPIASAVSSGGHGSRKEYEKQEKARQEKYGAYIEDQKARIEAVASLQRETLTQENPDPLTCLNVLFGLQRTLWEREPQDSDFLCVRAGMGYEDLCVTVKSRAENNPASLEDDTEIRLAEEIIEQTRIVDSVPLRLPLAAQPFTGVIGPRHQTVDLIRNLIVCLTAAHAPADVRLAGIFPPEERPLWEEFRFLPHVWDEEGEHRLLAFDRENAHVLCEFFRETLAARRAARLPDGAGALPHYVIVFGAADLTEKEDFLRELFADGPVPGLSCLFLFDELTRLPHGCRYLVDLTGTPCVYERDQINRRRYFTPDECLGEGPLSAYARRMSAVKLIGVTARRGLPASVSFLEGYGVTRTDELDVPSRWAQARPYESLAAPIGALEGGQVFSLDIHEKAHGPHGLVAGTTGSGKSEALQSWILSMALTFHPHDVSFVLIDYKGGGMANLLEPLPHVVGKLTNLGSGITRSLVSLQSEIRRRMALFDAAGVNHIDKYQKLYHAGTVNDPLPHLILVADEFAELKKEEPAFMAGLVSASRVGRSLGIHLILATQKPGGVVDDQIQSNARFRLCLKVQDAADSREMLKRPDAARITQPGRGYIRVGEDEIFECFQSFYSGAPYAPEEPSAENPLRFVEEDGTRRTPIRKEKRSGGTDELTAVVQTIVRAAREAGIKRLPGPWMPELPEMYSLPEPAEGYPIGLRPEEAADLPAGHLLVPVGLFDRPEEQAQGIQVLDLDETGHLAVYGAPGTGKTSFLRTLLRECGRRYAPSELQLFVIDAGGWSLKGFEAMPHVGGVVLDAEEDGLKELIAHLSSEMDRRRELFRDAAVGSLAGYREETGEKLPSILLLIDNLVPLFENCPALEPLLVRIGREGLSYGLHLIFTANSAQGIRFRVLGNVKGAIAFEMTDKNDLIAAVGRADASALAGIRGRAYAKGTPPVLFQTALYAPGETEKARMQVLEDEFAALRERFADEIPQGLVRVPDTVTDGELQEAFVSPEKIPLGRDKETGQILLADLSARCGLLAACADTGEGLMMLIRAISLFTQTFPETRVTILDTPEAPLGPFDGVADHYAAGDPEQETALTGELVALCEERGRKKKAGEDLSGEAPVLIILTDLTVFAAKAPEEANRAIERIVRFGAGLRVFVLAAGDAEAVGRLASVESLTAAFARTGHGLLFGLPPAQAPYFACSLPYEERRQPLPAGTGAYLSEGGCVRFILPAEGE